MIGPGRRRTPAAGGFDRDHLSVVLERVERRLDALEQRFGLLEALDQRLAGLEAISVQVSALDERLRDLEGRLERQVQPMLATLLRDDPGHRRALFALRDSADYELAYTDPDPLVTVLVCTHAGRTEQLIGRALPSALSQTHANLEVVVVGDAVGPELAEGVATLGEPRVRVADLTQAYAHPDPDRRWLAPSTTPRNEGLRLSRGRWITELDDDDALRPGAVAALLTLARRDRLEVAYGVIEQHDPVGPSTRLGSFPPRPLDPRPELPYVPWAGQASAAALAHAGLRVFAREHAAADIPAPGDYFRLERMVRAGVRFGMLDEVVYDYYPATLWAQTR